MVLIVVRSLERYRALRDDIAGCSMLAAQRAASIIQILNAARRDFDFLSWLQKQGIGGCFVYEQSESARGIGLSASIGIGLDRVFPAACIVEFPSAARMVLIVVRSLERYRALRDDIASNE
jgi:hypothetical protein